MIRDLSGASGIGVLLDDPLTGRLLLDCGVGVATGAALDGVDLSGVRGAVFTGVDPRYRDPVVAARLPETAPASAKALPIEDAPHETAWLVGTSRGAVLHYPGAGRLTAAARAELPATLILSRPVNAAVRTQLEGVTVLDAPGRRILVTGGARSGKSAFAERLLADEPSVLYLAAGPIPGPDDVEWQARVDLHRQRRPAHWRTHEGTDVRSALGGDTPVLLDCLGTWLTATMDATNLWEPTPAEEQQERERQFRVRVDGLVQDWSDCSALAVAVTNEVGSGVVPATSSGRRFRDELGRLNQAIAEHSDEVWLCTAGIGQRLK